MWSQSSSAKVWMFFCSPLLQQLKLPAQQSSAYCSGRGNLPFPWIRTCELI